MKKIILLLVLLLPIMVYAEEVNVKTIIPVDTKVSVKTEKFDYNDFIYNSSIDEKGNSLISFDSIKNNTISRLPISINILLFDKDQKNIGLVSYCTDMDLNSNYSGYKLSGNSSVPFSINIVSKYFVNGKSTSDVKYISVLDENKYCHVGGYDKYNGLTIDEIVNGVGNENKENEIIKLINKIKENGLVPIIVLVLVGILILVVLIMIISSVLKKIKNNKLMKNKDIMNDIPMEETVDLTYENVDNNETLEDDTSISMGVIDNSIENNKTNEKDNNEEDGSDLTKFFN